MTNKQREAWIAQTLAECRAAPMPERLTMWNEAVGKLPHREQIQVQAMFGFLQELLQGAQVAQPHSPDQVPLPVLIRSLTPGHWVAIVGIVGTGTVGVWTLANWYNDITAKAEIIKRHSGEPTGGESNSSTIESTEERYVDAAPVHHSD